MSAALSREGNDGKPSVPSPSSHRTCGFPASGVPKDLCHRHAQGTVNPMLGLVAQSGSRRRESFQGKDICSGKHAQAARSSFYPHTSLVGPLRSTGITPLPRYYEPRRLPTRTGRAVMLSRPPLNRSSSDRVSQVPGRSFGTRRPLSPRRARPVLVPVATRSMSGFTQSGRLATLSLCNEAETGSLLAARTFASRGFAPRITPTHARSATCRTGNSHGKLLSAHKIC